MPVFYQAGDRVRRIHGGASARYGSITGPAEGYDNWCVTDDAGESHLDNGADLRLVSSPALNLVQSTETYQATGMIMGQLNLGADAALERLRSFAAKNGKTVSQISREVIERRLALPSKDAAELPGDPKGQSGE